MRLSVRHKAPLGRYSQQLDHYLIEAPLSCKIYRNYKPETVVLPMPWWLPL